MPGFAVRPELYWVGQERRKHLLATSWERAFKAVAGLIAAFLVFTFASVAQAAPLRIVAFGDSLTAGYGIPRSAGVSGETASQGLARLDWSVPQGTDAVIVELGANDMLRGLDPAVTRKALTEIVQRLRKRGITVLLAGMKAAPNMGQPYREAFDSIYPDIAASEGVLLYPFFLEGIAGDRALNLPDGLHPNPEGVDRIVAGILPTAEQLVARTREAKAR